MQTRILLLLVGCALLLSATAIIVAAAPQEGQSKAELEKELGNLLHERVKTAERAMEAMQAAYQAATVTFFPLVDAANQLVEARLAAAATPAEERAALEKHLALMQSIEDEVKRLYDAGARGGEDKEYATAQRERQSAQIALIKARLKAER